MPPFIVGAALAPLFHWDPLLLRIPGDDFRVETSVSLSYQHLPSSASRVRLGTVENMAPGGELGKGRAPSPLGL